MSGDPLSGRDSLGEVEHLLLLAIVRLGPEAYSVTIQREVEARSGRELALGALALTRT